MLENIPNMITLMRMMAVAPICWLLWHDSYTAALWLLVLAGASDGLDGFLARRYGWQTRLGAILDPLADKLFIVVIMLLFGAKGVLPWWLVGMVMARDVVIICGALLYRWLTRSLEMRPLFISKINTALQILLLAVTLLHIGFYPVAPWLWQGLQWAVAATTLLSGMAYIFWWTYFALCNEASA